MNSQFSQYVPQEAQIVPAMLLSHATGLYGIGNQQGFSTMPRHSAPNGAAVFTLAAFDNSLPAATEIEDVMSPATDALVQPDWFAVDVSALGLIQQKQLPTLQQHYAVISEDDLIIEALTDVPALYALLKGAVEPLRSAFGEKALLQLEALETDEEGIILRVMVNLPAETEKPAELMRGFKQDWWFENCSRSEAALVFDYEIGNGF